jgi:pectate lyase
MSDIVVPTVSGTFTVFAPDIEGFAEDTVGGAGGTLYTVTNTNDSGAGSFREACEASGARIVEFNVSGDIELQTKISITNNNITIRGWKAPNGGICIRTDPDMLTEAIEIKASEVIISSIRIRPGPSTLDSSTLDAISLRSGSNIVRFQMLLFNGLLLLGD